MIVQEAEQMKDWNGLLSLTIVLPFTIPQIVPFTLPSPANCTLSLQTAHCYYKLHTVTTNCTMSLQTAHRSKYITPCMVHTAHLILLPTRYTLHTAHCTLHTTHCILHTAHCTLHTAHCTLPSTQYTYSTLHATSCTLKYYYLSMYCLFVKHNWSFLTYAWEARELGEGNSSYWKLSAAAAHKVKSWGRGYCID